MVTFAVPPVVALGAGESRALTAMEIARQLHPRLAGPTHAWSYDDDGQSQYSGYLGPTIVVQSGNSATLTYTTRYRRPTRSRGSRSTGT
jgi:FtsP/CotA-like multicopper oxidase with cupredoxin domain